MDSSQEYLRVGTLMVRLGYTTVERVSECLELQKKMISRGMAPKRLERILLAKGYVTEDQLRAASQSEENPNSGHPTIRGYTLLEKIGEDAYTAVYKAHQVSMDRTVFIKCLVPMAIAKEALKDRFLREAKAVAQLNHPNLLRGIDVGDSQGMLYQATEYADGPTLERILRRGGALDEKRAVNVALQTARAIEHLWSRGLVHGKVIPRTIILTRDGVAKLSTLEFSSLGNHEGKGGGRSAESLEEIRAARAAESIRESKNAGWQTDIRLLGACFYEMTVGQPPPAQGASESVLRPKKVRSVPSARARNPLLSLAVDTLIQRMMMTGGPDGYQTSEDVVGALEAVEQDASQPGPAPKAPGESAPKPPLRRALRRRTTRRFRRR